MVQTILTKLTDQKAVKEVKQFSIAGLVLSLISLAIFWWLAIAGLACSLRGLLLTWHKANKGEAGRYRLVAAAGFILGLIAIVLHGLV